MAWTAVGDAITLRDAAGLNPEPLKGTSFSTVDAYDLLPWFATFFFPGTAALRTYGIQETFLEYPQSGWSGQQVLSACSRAAADPNRYHGYLSAADVTGAVPVFDKTPLGAGAGPLYATCIPDSWRVKWSYRYLTYDKHDASGFTVTETLVSTPADMQVYYRDPHVVQLGSSAWMMVMVRYRQFPYGTGTGHCDIADRPNAPGFAFADIVAWFSDDGTFNQDTTTSCSILTFVTPRM